MHTMHTRLRTIPGTSETSRNGKKRCMHPLMHTDAYTRPGMHTRPGGRLTHTPAHDRRPHFRREGARHAVRTPGRLVPDRQGGHGQKHPRQPLAKHDRAAQHAHPRAHRHRRPQRERDHHPPVHPRQARRHPGRGGPQGTRERPRPPLPDAGRDRDRRGQHGARRPHGLPRPVPPRRARRRPPVRRPQRPYWSATSPNCRPSSTNAGKAPRSGPAANGTALGSSNPTRSPACSTRGCSPASRSPGCTGSPTPCSSTR